MALDDIIAKAKNALGDGKADGALDKAAELIKGKTPDNVDGKVDQAVEAAKKFLDKK
ncbi:Rv0909 family putative TA system antitoxin [Serinibacter arcticus]|jgi:MT0933-like antitoxin protein|uniref:Antitoxin n=1 Tax=Serinibacter arcticus TaxID=1655435 RepID=A0A4Z1E3B8_9MICO|nr:Rv0909 family putative TA system antitoxin [Serinibacter arcticus]TGO05252.1 hypothetical protein SERN_1256 [Serinibacter arcticus]